MEKRNLTAHDRETIRDIFRRENEPFAQIILEMKLVVWGKNLDGGLVGEQKKQNAVLNNHEVAISNLQLNTKSVEDAIRSLKRISYIILTALVSLTAALIVQLLSK